MLHHVNIGLKVKQCVHEIPSIAMEANIQPITRTVLRVRLTINPDFKWHDQVKKNFAKMMGHYAKIKLQKYLIFSAVFLIATIDDRQ